MLPHRGCDPAPTLVSLRRQTDRQVAMREGQTWKLYLQQSVSELEALSQATENLQKPLGC